MPTEALQRKIKVTGELREIVSNMKTLSSVSILQYERANASLEKYQKNLRDAFLALSLHNGVPKIAISEQKKKKYLLLLVGSDNGMVGRFNKEVVEEVKRYLKKNNIKTSEASCITIGKRVGMLAEQAKFSIFAGYGMANSVKSVTLLAETLILKLDEATRKNDFTDAILFYHQRKSHGNVGNERRRIIPFDPAGFKYLKKQKWETNNIPMVAADYDKMFAALVNEALIITISKSLHASLAAEHFTRMTNMQNAEKNIDENLEEMNLLYQQQRQDEITDELIDVISGANAMRKT